MKTKVRDYVKQSIRFAKLEQGDIISYTVKQSYVEAILRYILSK